MISDQQTRVAIQSIDQLISTLETEDVTKYNDIIRHVELTPEALDGYGSWSTESYTRNCIAEHDKFELILLCWEQGQSTPIHNHGGEECWVRIIEGELQETIYKSDESGNLNEYKTIVSHVGDVTYMIDFMGVHSIANMSTQKSRSLHLYAKPIRSCKIFDENTNTFILKELSYCTRPEVSRT